ncbi:hypothetical protein MKW98_028850 [Papaver atlanticum]|uniref:Uncharacterized protein n=1 Tax=Papaver atlanticum TaxID=357466 RepID=A0AAD4X6T5_9MAGN|nr:hypothetical protein MKW98_028850 [Papaver atlanticum]
MLSVTSRNSAVAEEIIQPAAPSVIANNQREIVVSKKNNVKDSNESQLAASSRNLAPSVITNQSKVMAFKKNAQNQASEGVLQLTQKFKVEPIESLFACVDCGKKQRVILHNFVIKGLHGFCSYCGMPMTLEFR